MAKELPYFRFTVQEWQNGDISLESYELKGLFIDICAYYWLRDCTMDRTILNKKFSNAKAMIDELIDLDIIHLYEYDNETININFLDEQFDLLSEKRKKRQEAGRTGGLKKSSNAKAMLKQKSGYKDKDNNKDKDKSIPTLDEFKKYALEKNPNVNTKQVEKKYNDWVANDWKDGKGNDIVSWKGKLFQTIRYFDNVAPTYDKMDLNFDKNEAAYSVEEKKALINKIYTTLKSDKVWIEDVARAAHLNQTETWQKIDDFIITLKAQEDYFKPIKDIKSHCVNLIKKNTNTHIR